MTADLLSLLDQLDEARAAATPAPWISDSHEIYQEWPGIPGLSGEWLGETCRVPGDPLHDTSDANATLIVAAVNALPKLTAALRAVLARHYPRGRNIWGDEVCTAGHSVLEPWPCPDYVAVCAALGHLPDCGDRAVGGCARPAGHSGGHVAPSAYEPDAPPWAEDRERRTAALTPESVPS